MIPYLLAADVQNTVLAALLTFTDRVLYPGNSGSYCGPYGSGRFLVRAQEGASSTAGVSRGGGSEPPIETLVPAWCALSLLVPTVTRSRLMLSVVLSIGGGIARHFTSLDVGRWWDRLVAKC